MEYLFDRVPHLQNEWNYKLNEGLDPKTIKPMSDKEAWWTCSFGHTWRAVVKSRTKGHGCPYCTGRKPVTGENDLATLNPELAKEWHPIKMAN